MARPARGGDACSRGRSRADTCCAICDQRAHQTQEQVRDRCRSARAAKAGCRAIPVRCGCGRCEFCRPVRRLCSFNLRMTKVWMSSSVAPSRNFGSCASVRMSSKARTNCPRSSAVRMPARSSARAKACDPRQSASSSFLSKWSDPEKRSKTSDGPARESPAPEFLSATRLPLPHGRGSVRAHGRGSVAAFDSPAACARTLIGNPIKLMKPSASFWLYSAPMVKLAMLSE